MTSRWHAHQSRGSARFAIVVALLLSLVAGACGGSGPGSTAGEPGGQAGLTVETEGIVLSPGVTQIDAATVETSLETVRADGTLVFDADTRGVGDLVAGDVILVEGVAPRKVTGVSAEGSMLAVATEDAAITDVITDGKLGWTYEIAFDDLPDATYESAMAEIGLHREGFASSAELDREALERFAVKGESLRFVGKVKGFEIEFKLVPKATQLDFELSAERSNVKIQAGGFISQFTQEARMEFDGGTGTFFDASVTGLKGEAEITWHAFEVDDPSFDQDIVAFVMPLTLPIPFTVGPIPMTLNIKMNIRVVPELTGGNASSGGSWKVTYDTEHGFSTNGGDVSPKAQLKNLAADLGKEPTVTAGLGVVAFAVGMEWPRLELQLGHPLPLDLLEAIGEDKAELIQSLLRPYVFLTLNTFVDGRWTPGTLLTADIPPCQRSSIRISAIAGYKLSVLGMVQLNDNTLLWERQVDKFKDNKPCTLTGN